MSVYAKVWAYDQHPLQVDKDGSAKDDTRNPAAKAVLVALAEYPGVGQRECWPSQETLSVMTDFDVRTVRKHLDVLEKQGYIARKERHRDGKRTTDMVTLLGPVEVFGPSQVPKKQPERGAGSNRNVMSKQPERGAGEPVLEPSVETSLSPEGTEKPVTADEFVSYLAEELDAADVPYAAGWRGRHGKQFKECIGKDVSTETLYKACDRIAERWTDERHHKLTVEHALGDVLNGTPPKHVSAVPASGGNGTLNGTPQEITEYVFANTRNPVIKSGEERIRSAMATFDFTGGDSPPYPVQKKLGGDDSEAWAVLEGIRTLCKRSSAERGAA